MYSRQKACNVFLVTCAHDAKDMGERKIHMQKPLFKTMEALTLRKIGPHFLLYATEDIDAQYSRCVGRRCRFGLREHSRRSYARVYSLVFLLVVIFGIEARG